MVFGRDEQQRGTLIPATNGPKLVVIGDSILEKSTRELTAELRRAGSDLQVVNLAVGGSALSYDVPKNWNKAAPMIAASLKNGDKVIINLGHSDFYAMGKRHGWDNSFLDKNTYMTKADYLKRYEDMVRTFQSSGAEVYVAGPAPYLKPEPGSSSFIQRHYTAATQRIPVLSKELQDLAKRTGAHFIATIDNKELQQANSRINDGLHLSDTGRTAFARQIAGDITQPASENKFVAKATPAPTTPKSWTVSKPVA